VNAVEFELEIQIAASAKAVALAVSRDEKVKAIELLNELVKQRTPEAVAELEILKGLRSE